MAATPLGLSTAAADAPSAESSDHTTAAPILPDCPPEAPHADAHPHQSRMGFWGLTLGSVGVVFGDIGTSPLYAFQAAMVQAAKDRVTDASILGVVSMALWALLLVVTVKYVLFVMRADNKGEGGVLSLMALAGRALGQRTRLVFVLGVVGAAPGAPDGALGLAHGN